MQWSTLTKTKKDFEKFMALVVVYRYCTYGTIHGVANTTQLIGVCSFGQWGIGSIVANMRYPAEAVLLDFVSKILSLYQGYDVHVVRGKPIFNLHGFFLGSDHVSCFCTRWGSTRQRFSLPLQRLGQVWYEEEEEGLMSSPKRTTRTSPAS